jgi:HPt (histidine-containing phosphotransfer) domain-containing protein
MFISTVQKTRQKRGWPAPAALEQLKQDLGVEFVAELVDAFLDHLAVTVPLVVAAAAAGDLACVAKEAHSIKGSSRQLGIEVTSAICEQIETFAKENKLDEVQSLTERLEEESKAVRRVLGTYRKKLSAEQSEA